MKKITSLCIILNLFSLFLLHANGAGAEMKTFSPSYKKLMDKLENLTPKNSINVNIGTEFEEYKVGDPFEMRFMASEDCYVVLMDISTNGDITFIAPSVVMLDNKVEGERVYSTVSDFNMNIKVAPPGGIETINILCSPEKFDLFEYDVKEESLYIIKTHDEERIRKLIESLEQLEQHEWAGNSVSFKIKDPQIKKSTRGAFTKKGGVLPPIGTTGTTGKFFPPIGSTGTTGKSALPPIGSTGTTGHSGEETPKGQQE
ncbi:MAG: DUF4384 domain-containing protein [bacterium]|nr:DUF4384 domain-containing protein [bacterium]